MSLPYGYGRALELSKKGDVPILDFPQYGLGECRGALPLCRGLAIPHN